MVSLKGTKENIMSRKIPVSLNCATKALGRKASVSSGFTLIELLVVIAIIAILAAILFPVFARARENARRTSCASNLKQLGLGIMQYTQDYDEKLPNDWDGAHSYKQHIQPYLKSAQIWVCPSNPQNAIVGNPADPSANLPEIRRSYASNPRLIMPGWAGTAPSLSFVQNVSQKIIITEALVDWGIMYTDWTLQKQPTKMRDEGWAGHMGTMNCLFVDGHVKSMRPTQTGTPVNMWGTMEDNSNTGDCSYTPWQTAYTNGINCDEVSPGQVESLNALANKYN
jgi:prepilin-type N-terminal cleavage/methylation domain-containing protein/prepilin-type processing-associated H-X9-DG protein